MLKFGILVGLVQRYSNKSGGASHLRKLAAAGPGRRPDAQRSLPRKARQLTDDEKMAFVEDYQQGEPIADLAAKLGVHRTTLDNLVKHLELTRANPADVPEPVKHAIVAAYRDGDTLSTIGSRHGFSPNKVQRLIVGVGDPIRPRGARGSVLSAEQVRGAMQRYEAGESLGMLAIDYEVSYACIRKHLLAAGTSLRARGGARN